MQDDVGFEQQHGAALMVDYVETPWDPIVGVHWASGTPTPCVPVIFCNPGYGYGATVVDTGLIITFQPSGADQHAPFVGTWDTVERNGPSGAYGGLLHPYVDPSGHLIAPTVDAAPDGLAMQQPLLTASALIFTNDQLLTLDDGTGHSANEFWSVPMAEGSACVTFPPSTIAVPIPMVVKSYTIEMEWSVGAVGAGDEVGIALCHPTSAGGLQTPPAEPTRNLGPRSGGSATFTYAFKYKTWLDNFGRVIDDSNKADLSLGGPVLLYWMHRRFDAGSIPQYGPWVQHGVFMADSLGILGDFYHWKITPTCQPSSSAI